MSVLHFQYRIGNTRYKAYTPQEDTVPICGNGVGDGVCDDELNTPKCEYDGLDCCLAERNWHIVMSVNVIFHNSVVSFFR
jgi:hypothetical protein